MAVGVEFVSRVVFHDVSTGINSSLVFGAGSVNFTIDASLADEELDSTQLNDLSRLKFIAQVFPVLLFEFSDDKICFFLGLDVA